MRTVCLVVLSMVLLGASVQAEDGGVLTFNANAIKKNAPSPWPFNRDLLFSNRPATMQLDGMGPEKVMVGSSFSWEPAQAVSVDPPYRFFRDLNCDGKCQPGEIYTAVEATDKRKVFRGIPYPLPVAGIETGVSHIPGITQTLLTDVVVLGDSVKKSAVWIKRIQSGYGGTVSIGGTEYPALLTYRSLQNPIEPIDGIILLDTNRDGSFDHFHDPWMLCNGTGVLAGEVWEVTTTFSGETATVQVKPYLGETGEMRVMGDGVLRAYVELTPYTNSKAYQSSRPRHSTLCLARREDGLYKLPAGHYTVKKNWVENPSNTETLYEALEPFQYFRIDEDNSIMENLGGPVSGNIQANLFHAMLGYVFLDPGDSFKSPSGIRFKPTTLSLILEGGDLESVLPGYEICNSAGRVVTTGQFEYG